MDKAISLYEAGDALGPELVSKKPLKYGRMSPTYVEHSQVRAMSQFHV